MASNLNTSEVNRLFDAIIGNEFIKKEMKKVFSFSKKSPISRKRHCIAYFQSNMHDLIMKLESEIRTQKDKQKKLNQMKKNILGLG